MSGDKEVSSVPCGLCGTPTLMTGTKRCDACWELESRIQGNPTLAAKILAGAGDTSAPSATRQPDTTQEQAGVNAYQQWKANVSNERSSAFGGNLHDLARRMYEAMTNAAPQEISAEASSRADGEAGAAKKPGATASTQCLSGEAETPCGAAPLSSRGEPVPCVSGEAVCSVCLRPMEQHRDITAVRPSTTAPTVPECCYGGKLNVLCVQQCAHIKKQLWPIIDALQSAVPSARAKPTLPGPYAVYEDYEGKLHIIDRTTRTVLSDVYAYDAEPIDAVARMEAICEALNLGSQHGSVSDGGKAP
jgi:hypothetical protein